MGLLSAVLAGVAFGCLVGAIIGLVRPAAFAKPAKDFFPTRLNVVATFGVSAMIAGAGSISATSKTAASTPAAHATDKQSSPVAAKPKPNFDDVLKASEGCRNATNAVLVKLRAGEIDRTEAAEEAKRADEVCIGEYDDVTPLIINDDRAYEGCHNLLSSYQVVDRAIVTATERMTPESFRQLSFWVNRIHDDETTCGDAIAYSVADGQAS